MSRTTKLINNIKEKLDSVSGLDGDYIQERLEKIENLVNKTVKEIDKHCDEDETNGTIFKNTSADKMFEKLGYDNRFNNFYEHDFGTTIEFKEEYKEILINGAIDMRDLQAINEKVKELGWESN